MTTIAYRDGIMAADSRAYAGDKHPIGSKVKIRRLEDGTLIGASTTIVGGGERVLDWIEGGMDNDEVVPESFQVLVVRPGGKIFVGTGNCYLSGPLDASYIAIGSGEQYAHGALMMGASAVEAVRVACHCDPWTATPIYTATHRRKRVVRIER